MKKVVKIFVILIILGFCSINCYATTEENTVSNKVKENTVQKEEKKEEPTPTETKKNETMYVQERCNIRSSYSVESDRVGGLDVGTEVTVIAEYSNGWYKIKYDGGEAYIKAGILRSTKPEIPEETTEETETTTEEESSNTEKIVENTAEDDLAKEIGVLPEVGRNIADYLFVGSIFVAIAGVIYLRKEQK